jgi:hypothetical protein
MRRLFGQGAERLNQHQVKRSLLLEQSSKPPVPHGIEQGAARVASAPSQAPPLPRATSPTLGPTSRRGSRSTRDHDPTASVRNDKRPIPSRLHHPLLPSTSPNRPCRSSDREYTDASRRRPAAPKRHPNGRCGAILRRAREPHETGYRLVELRPRSGHELARECSTSELRRAGKVSPAPRIPTRASHSIVFFCGAKSWCGLFPILSHQANVLFAAGVPKDDILRIYA